MDEFSKKLDQIEKAIESELYHPALALALTIPDVCGKIRYGYKEAKNDQERYTKWYNEYVLAHSVSKWRGDPSEIRNPEFNGRDLWNLRCEYLHAGKANVLYFENVPYGYKFELNIGNIGLIVYSGNNDCGMYSSTIKVYDLCYEIVYGARRFYKEVEKKEVFEDRNIVYKAF
jgi:hypothetical protein